MNRLLRYLLRVKRQEARSENAAESQDTIYLHEDYSIKAGEHLLTFLKAEQDRHIARARLFESRAQTMATFAGAAGSLAALLKPAKPTLEVLALLVITAFLTLSVLYQAFEVHKNRDSSTGGDKPWATKLIDNIWHQKVPPMSVIHELQENYVNNIEEAKKVAEDKAAAIKELQLFLRLQLFFVILTILFSAWQGKPS